MDVTKHANYQDLLRKRRHEVTLTLAHVQTEQRAMDENKDRIDRAAYESRARLLANLAGWYIHETARIDDALIRVAEGKYGFCVACHNRIGAERLKLTPEAALCAACETASEELSSS